MSLFTKLLMTSISVASGCSLLPRELAPQKPRDDVVEVE